MARPDTTVMMRYGKRMNLVLVHNVYQHPGGEDQVFAAEAALLEDHGHDVTRYTVHNDAVAGMGQAALAKATVWNAEQYRTLRELFSRVRPDVVHVHNTLPLISPAVYYAAKSEGAAVVQTLHNYRLVCPSGLLFRDGAPCELCVGKAVPWPGVLHACYRGSRAASGAVAAMLTVHRARGTYRHMVDRYIALTEFAKGKFVQGGVRADRVDVKPNFLAHDPGVGRGDGGYALFVGRLSTEKGLKVLLDAWQRIGARLPLRIAGDGPLADEVASWAAGTEGVTLLGRLSSSDVMDEMKGAALLVVPSIWYEGFPMTIVEAFAVGTPVLASRLGAMAEVVDHGRTGLHFTPGDAASLAAEVLDGLSHPSGLARFRPGARREYETEYSADTHYRQLLEIYDSAAASGRADEA